MCIVLMFGCHLMENTEKMYPKLSKKPLNKTMLNFTQTTITHNKDI